MDRFRYLLRMGVMFWMLALISMLGYTIQGVLMAHFIRKIDPLSIGFYRNLTFVVSLLPLLLLANFSEIIAVKDYWQELAFAAMLGAAAQWSSFWTVRYFPLGIAGAIKMGLFAIFSIILGVLFAEEFLNGKQVFAVIFILFGAILLGRNDEDKMPHLEPVSFLKGTILLVLTSVLMAVSFFFVAKVSRDLNPGVSGYFWETGIAFFAGLFLLCRKWFTGQSIEKISWKTFGLIFLTAWPTLLGTGGFVLAVKYGPVGLVNVIGVSGVFVSVILAHFLYQEKLRPSHWWLITMIVVGIIALKVF